MKLKASTLLITTVLPDRIGILRDVTGVIFEAGGNLTDLRQIIMGGVFALSCVATFETNQDCDTLREAILSGLPEDNANIVVIPCALNSSVNSPVSGERYAAAVSGPDRPGRVHMIAKIFAAHGVNVEDWRHDLSDPNRALTIGLVRVPAGCDVQKLQTELAADMAKFNMVASLRHENIFRATNEVGPIDALLITNN